MHNPTRLLWSLAVLLFLTGASITVAQSAEGATSAVTSKATGLSPASFAGAAQSEPVHWVTGLQPHATGSEQASTNWSGDVDLGPQFTGASGQWVVPAVQPSTTPEFSATWIGVDGVSDADLIQTGTAQETSRGYYAWYEIIPSNPNTATYLWPVAPGDHIVASVQQNSPGTWTISITDTSSPGKTFTQAVAYSGPGSSAEWIEEAPTVDGQQSTLANFGTAQFTNIGETTSGSAVTHTPVAMVNGTGSVIASPGPLMNGSLTITYDGPSTPSGPHGYWLVGSDGGIFTFGSAPFYGSTGSLVLQRPVVGMTVTADRGGYWLVAADGGVFSFGDAAFFGSIPGLGYAPAGSGVSKELNAPIVGMVPSSDGGGYFMVGADGGVFAFGDAKFEGSCPAIGGCAGAAVTVMPDASGNGYWLVTATGHVYAFGDATGFGAPGATGIPVTSATRTADGGGYWILFANGAVNAYGDAANLGGPVGQTGGLNPATAILSTADGGGYWVSSAAGAIYTFGDAPYDGGMNGTHLNGSIIAGTGY
jgi:hypothetical protein